MKYVGLVCLFFVVSVVFAHAQTNSQFKVALLIGADTTPPSTPQNLVADPVSVTQIDLAWDASTDNYIFGGYQVFRDAVQIATTTLTSYSDTNLATSTLYTYYVTAFDDVGNVSSSSASVATTTLSAPPPPVATSTATTTNTGSSNPLIPVDTLIDNFHIDTTETTAEVTFSTNVSVQTTYLWGRTTLYEIGYIYGDGYRKEHQTLITNLQPGTTYELEIILVRKISGDTIVKRVQFTTDEAPDQTAPPNVMDLTAMWTEDGIDLAWENPLVDDFAYIRIASSDIWYPGVPQDGRFVFQGDDEYFFDNDKLVTGVRYYSVFTYDTAGNRSSGAVVAVAPPGYEIGEEEQPISDLADTTRYNRFSFDDLSVLQNDLVNPSFHGIVTVSQEYDATLRLPYDVLPEHLKTIVLSLRSTKDGSVFSVILSINNVGTHYEATIGSLSQIGEYEATLSVYDYRTRNIIKRYGEVNVTQELATSPIQRIETVLHINWPLLISLIVLLLLAVWTHLRRLKKSRDGGNQVLDRTGGNVSLTKR